MQTAVETAFVKPSRRRLKPRLHKPSLPPQTEEKAVLTKKYHVNHPFFNPLGVVFVFVGAVLTAVSAD